MDVDELIELKKLEIMSKQKRIIDEVLKDSEQDETT